MIARAAAFLLALAMTSATIAIAIATAALANAPVGHFVAQSDGTVFDSATRLTWERRASNATYSFKQAGSYCEALSPETAGWRLPTVKELSTLVDESRSMPAIDIVAFADTKSDFYWSSSPLPGDPEQALGVSFRFGFDSAFETSTPHFVRCVH